MQRMIVSILLGVTILKPAPADAELPPASAAAILGAWSCVKGPCFDPEIEFAVEEDRQIFRSWLHHRPSAICEWSLRGRSLSLTCGSGLIFTYEVVKATRRTLILREEERSPARYRRIKEGS